MTVKANAAVPVTDFLEVDMEMKGDTVTLDNESADTPPPALRTGGLPGAALESEVIDLDSFDSVSEAVGSAATGDADISGARAFAIADAIRLLQSLPAAPRVDMVVRVLRVTLGSADVSVDEMSEELSRRTRVLDSKLRALRAQEAELDAQLHAKRAEVAGQELELKHLLSVKSRLQMTTQPASHRPPPIPPSARKPIQSEHPVPAIE